MLGRTRCSEMPGSLWNKGGYQVGRHITGCTSVGTRHNVTIQITQKQQKYCLTRVSSARKYDASLKESDWLVLVNIFYR